VKRLEVLGVCFIGGVPPPLDSGDQHNHHKFGASVTGVLWNVNKSSVNKLLRNKAMVGRRAIRDARDPPCRTPRKRPVPILQGEVWRGNRYGFIRVVPPGDPGDPVFLEKEDDYLRKSIKLTDFGRKFCDFCLDK
jgi:hypothetical protein